MSLRRNHLVVSDLHLTLVMDDEDRATDHEIAAFLDHYRQHRVRGLPWRLVFAGDTFDFQYPSMARFLETSTAPHAPRPRATNGMSVVTEQGRPSAPGRGRSQRSRGDCQPDRCAGGDDPYERRDVDSIAWRLRRTMHEHAEVFVALGRFVLAGNDLVLITGNHDVEMQWAKLRECFITSLFEIVRAVVPEVVRAALEQRVAFRDWFYLDSGKLYVEHGNQYDDRNSLPNLAAPALLADASRAFLPLGTRLTLHVTNAFPDYKPRPTPDAFLRYLATTGQRWSRTYWSRGLRVFWDSMSRSGPFSAERYRTRDGRDESVFARIREQTQVPKETLCALQALQARPITMVSGWFLRLLLLDRILVVGVCLALIGLGAALGVLSLDEPSLLAATVWVPVTSIPALLWRFKVRGNPGYLWAIPAVLTLVVAGVALVTPGATVLGTLFVTLVCLVGSVLLLVMPMSRSEDLRRHLTETAGRVGRLMKVPLVVFGHQHQALIQRLPAGVTYVNSGAWVSTGIDHTHAHVVVLDNLCGLPEVELVLGCGYLRGSA